MNESLHITLDDLFETDLSNGLLAVITVLHLIGWGASHYFALRTKLIPIRFVLFALRVAILSSAFWFGMQWVGRFIVFTTVRPYTILAIGTALAIEWLIALYALEMRIVSKRLGAILLGCRIAAVLVLLGIFLKPVREATDETSFEREIAIVLDESASMSITDDKLRPQYALNLGEFFSASEVKGRLKLHEQVASRLHRMQVQLRRLTGDTQRDLDAIQGFPDEGEAMVDFLARHTDQEAGDRIRALLESIRSQLPEQYSKLEEALQNKDSASAVPAMERLGESLQTWRVEAEQIQRIADDAFWKGLSPTSRANLAARIRASRLDIGKQLLNGGNGKRGLFDVLEDDYKIRLFRAGSGAIADDWKTWRHGNAERPDGGFRDQTNLAGSLEAVIKEIPAHKLAGAIVISDGAVNAGTSVSNPARELGAAQVPVVSILTGSSMGNLDAVVVDLDGPRKVRAGKQFTLVSDLRFVGMRGSEVDVVLMEEDREIEKRKVAIGSESQFETVRFTLDAERLGKRRYTISLPKTPEEKLTLNNTMSVEVETVPEPTKEDFVTDVLLIDNFPRWEYRYLRNLFAERDKTVKFQHLLMHPEEIQGAPRPPRKPASVSLPFEVSQVNALPESAPEWNKFNVIILGDLKENQLTQDQWKMIEETVGTAGALLICIAGQVSMPHAITNDPFRALLPANYKKERGYRVESPERNYRLELTPEGVANPVLMIGKDEKESNAVWKAIPPLAWRSPVESIKPGAEVLAYARPINTVGQFEVAKTAAELKAMQEKNALIVAHRYGLGRVVMLNFDRTFRLRYGVGDRFHHQFWWQLIQWKVEIDDLLKSGGEFAKIRTDATEYELNDTIRVKAKVTNAKYESVTDSTLRIEVLQGEKVVSKKSLRSTSDGAYEATLSSLSGAGKYQLRLAANGAAAPIIRQAGEELTQTEITINEVKSRELTQTEANPETMETLAGLSGGIFLEPGQSVSLRDLFKPPTHSEVKTETRSIWDTFPTIFLFVGLLVTEWVIRKRGGLA